MELRRGFLGFSSCCTLSWSLRPSLLDTCFEAQHNLRFVHYIQQLCKSFEPVYKKNIEVSLK